MRRLQINTAVWKNFVFSAVTNANLCASHAKRTIMNLLFRFLFLSLFFASPLAASRMGTTIQGRILDAEQKPVEFVVVTLLHAADSSLVKTAMSSAEGRFLMDNIDTGSYFISAMQMGTGKLMHGPFVIAVGQAELQLPDLNLVPFSTETNEVEIVAQVPLLTMKPGMLVMNVESSPVRMSGTALDLVKKAPGVAVDQNGNISLRGKSGVQIYIDGKPTYLAQDQLNQLLQTMPATDVSYVEIITNPSSKYDAEGNTGIINIVTKKGARMGANGNVRVGAGYGFVPKVNAGINFNYGMEKGNFYSRYTIGRYQGKDFIDIDRNVGWNDTTTRFEQNSIFEDESYDHNGRIGYDYTPNERITLGIQANGSWTDSEEFTDNTTALSLVGLDTGLRLLQKNTGWGAFRNGGVGVNYKQVLDSTGREFTGSADYIMYSSYGRKNYETHFKNESDFEFAAPFFQRDKTNTDIAIWVGKVDYTHPFSKKWKLESGIKSSLVKTNNELDFDVLQQSEWVDDVSRTNTFIYKEQINAVYSQVSAELGKFQVQGGLRLEQTNSDGYSPTLNQQVKRSYMQLFPTLFVTHNINEKHQLSYSLSRRVNRPDYGALNPFIFYLDQYTYKKGNPFLRPELAINAEVTHSFMQFVFTTLSYSRTTNAMHDVTQQIDSIGATFQTTINMNVIENVSFSLVFPIPIQKWWMAENVFVAYYNHYTSVLFDQPLNIQNYAWYAQSTHSLSLPKDFKLEVSGYFQSRLVYGIFEIRNKGGVSLGVDKSFFKNKLSLSLSATDLFYTEINRVDITFGTQDVNLVDRNETRTIWLRARYQFGNDKAARRTQFQSGADDLKGRVKK